MSKKNAPATQQRFCPACTSRLASLRPLNEVMNADERQRVDLFFSDMKAHFARVKEVQEEQARIAAVLSAARDEMVGMLPAAVRKKLSQVFSELMPAATTDVIDGQPVSEATKKAAVQAFAAGEIGFFMAVVRYRDWLVGNREIAQILHGRETGQRRGHVTQSQRREQRAQLIRDTWATMEAAGQRPTNRSVAAAVGCGVSTVIRAFKSKPAKRTKR